MKIHNLVFSEKLIIRIARHLMFWLARMAYYYLWFLSLYFMFGSNDIKYLNSRPVLVSLIIDIIFCYLTVYVFLPTYLLKKKHLLFYLYICVLSITVFSIKTYYILWVFNGLKDGPEAITRILWYQLITFISSGPPVICMLFITIKILKLWYLKEEQKLRLISENSQSELNLLKAQVHPHFLFNTLNNIYSFTLSKSPLASKLILNLTDTLRYMINECDAALVPLEKEIKMIQDYIDLEKVRYGDRLKMEVIINGDSSNKLIAPLLLIPFVENSFKHGASKMLRYPWVKLQIIVEQNTLWVELGNSKPTDVNLSNGKNGIGLKNVKKRLSILYPDQHNLTIESTKNDYTVKIKIPLTETTMNDYQEIYMTKQRALYDNQ